MKIAKIRSELTRLSEGNQEYAEFNKKIVNTSKTMLGVRTPDLRKLARQIAREADFASLQELFKMINDQIYEEILLAGLSTNYAKLSDAERLALTKIYLSKADNWAHIDMFVEKQRHKYDRKFWYDFSISTLKSDQEFVVRYGVINLMSNYLDEEYLEKTLAELRSVKYDGYYVKMGLAWLYATAAAQNYNRIIQELARPEIDPWVKRKAYQKMLESYRMTNQQKSDIRVLRGKL